MSSISHTVAKPIISQPVSEKVQRKQHEKKDIVAVVGRIASVLSVIMYVSYLTQIANNLGGNPGSPWQPLCAFFNCTMWTIYGFMKPKRDIPIIVANIPGIVLGLITFITAIVH
ncbi:SemiSWEET family transporter [Adlercreutzia mucosicola]|uniref:SemiSWEET family transporter n=1 Tax=Adlercreutzia mucosicola TaxID=580026 RepID=UPI00040CBD52|nr:SemiSWEET family transporter [Adlercreutzia mucosicola]MCR2034286.1 SWEET family sugar transporter [Adlercreutzia mucosicola]